MENMNFNMEIPNKENTGLMVMDDNNNFVAELTSEKQVMFCSMVANTQKEKVTLFKAMNNPDARLGDCINMTIAVKDVFCEVVKCTNRETGEITQYPRIVLIDKDGKGYQCVSIGIFSALKKLFCIFGMPTWNEPVKIQVKQLSKGDRKILTFDVV